MTDTLAPLRPSPASSYPPARAARPTPGCARTTNPARAARPRADRAARAVGRPVDVRPRTTRQNCTAPYAPAAAARPRGTLCVDGSGRDATTVRPRPVTWATAVVAGLVLAAATWAIVITGTAVSDSAGPAVTGTAMVHVRNGESLADLAGRVAPDQSPQVVIADIKELNHLAGSALTAGEPLLAPRYR